MGLNWKRCSKQRLSRDVESKYGEGFQFPSGSVTPKLPRDALARRAEKALRRWLQTKKGRHR
jgi:hypothetical protein